MIESEDKTHGGRRMWPEIRAFAGSVFLCLAVLLTASTAWAAGGSVLCGVANGYPPYQFLDAAGEPAGMDIDVIRLIFERLGTDLEIRSGSWDDMVAALRLGKLDCVAGMEINERREIHFDFTSPYYNRHGVLFVREDNERIRSVYDLKWQVVAGDRDSFVEQYLRELGLYRHIRLFQTKSKDQSMQLLKRGEVVAAIAPVAVGLFLARRYDMPVRMIDVGDPGAPVGIAVAKGDEALLTRMNGALQELNKEGILVPVLKRWLPQ